MSLIGKMMMTLVFLLLGTLVAGLFTPHDHALRKHVQIVAGVLMAGVVAVGIAWVWI